MVGAIPSPRFALCRFPVTFTAPPNVAPDDKFTSSRVVSPITSRCVFTVAPPECVVAPVNVVTPEIETLSKSVCPSTSIPPDISKLDAVTAPTDILGVPDKFVAVPVVF